MDNNGYRNNNGTRQNFRPANQIIVQSNIRVSQNGVEMLEFTIPLGAFELRCSSPIPEEGTNGAPVYVQVRPTVQTSQDRPVARPRPAPRQNTGVNQNWDQGYDDQDDQGEEGDTGYGNG